MRRFLTLTRQRIKNAYEEVKDFFYYTVWWHGIRDFFFTARGYIRYNMNRHYMHLVWTVLSGYPWDYCFLYAMEKAKLEEMLAYQEKRNLICEEQREQILRTLRLAIRMLDILDNEDKLYHFEGFLRSFKVDGTDLHQLNFDCHEYHCDIKVNTRNIDRFVPKNGQRMYLHHQHELYLLKARHLYHKIRYYYTEYWWE